MMNMWRGRQPLRMAAEEDQGTEDLWGYMGGMGPQRPAVPVAPVAPAAPVAQPAGPSPAAADPYAAIRNLQFTPQPTYRPISEDEWGYENTWEGSQRVAPAGAVQIMGDDGNMGWAMPSGQSYDFDWDTARALENTPFRSKYSNVVALPDGRMQVTLQQPDAHKYDTMEAIYAQDPATGQWTLQNDPMQAKSRQVSTGESFVRDPLEQFGKDFVLPAVAMYTGAQFLAPYAAQATAALEGASAVSYAGGGLEGLSGMDLAADGGRNALWQTGATGGGAQAVSGMDLAADGGGNALWQTGTEGATKALADTLPEVMAAQPGIPASSIAPVTPPAPLPAMPSLNAAAPSLLDSLKSFGGSAKDWIKQNPNLARGLFTAAGGLAGGVGGPTGGATPAPQTFGPPQAWTSGLTMGGGGPGPRQRAPVIDYELPRAGGLSMGAGRFLGRGG